MDELVAFFLFAFSFYLSRRNGLLALSQPLYVWLCVYKILMESIQLIALPLHFCNHRTHLQHKHIPTLMMVVSLCLSFSHSVFFSFFKLISPSKELVISLGFHVVSFIFIDCKKRTNNTMKEFIWKLFLLPFRLKHQSVNARIQILLSSLLAAAA